MKSAVAESNCIESPSEQPSVQRRHFVNHELSCDECEIQRQHTTRNQQEATLQCLVAESSEVHPVTVLGLGDLACSAVRKTLAQFDRGETAERRQ
jgi:hypothetical protein